MHLTKGVGHVRRLMYMAAAITIAACGDEPSGMDTSGVRSWQIEAEPLVVLGETDSRPSEIFSRIAGVALLEDGGIVVGDGATATLRVFGPTGTFEAEMGGEGQGPGEFEYLNSIHAHVGDALVAYDPAAYRATTFSRSGQLLSTSQMETAGGAPEQYLGMDDQGRHLVSLIRPAPRDPTRVTADSMEVRRYESDGSSFVSLGSFPGMRRVRSPVPFSPHLLGAVVGSTVVVADGLLPGFAAFAGTVREEVSVEDGAGSRDLEEAWRRLEESLDGSDARERLQETRSGPRWDSIPRYSDMVVDPLGSIWLKDYDPGTDSHWVNRRLNGGRWTLISPEGRPIAAIALPDNFRLMAVGADRVAGVSRDTLGVERVLVYRLVRQASATP